MQKYILCCIAIIMLATGSVSAQDSYTANAKKYVARYYSLAMMEQRLNGIPAAITLGQGILETEAGTSELLTQANNHFGIKCRNGWTGETFAHTDDAPNECFKKYKCAEESYRDHSEMLKRSQRYAPLFNCKPTDYKGWAVCLRKCGYATNPQYAQQLIKIIEDFNLQQYTYSAFDTTTPNSSDYKVYAAAYVTPLPDTPAKRLVAKDTARPASPAPSRIVIVNDRHTVMEGETVASIAKTEGVDVKQIMEYNFLYPNEQPVPGSVLELQKPARRKPDVVINATPAHTGNAIVGDGDKTTGSDDGLITINKSKPADNTTQASVTDAAPVSEGNAADVAPPQARPAKVNSEAPHHHGRPLMEPVNNPAATAADDDPEKDKQFATIKSDLDKVVYADDSLLIVANATAPAPQTKPVPSASENKGSRFYTVKKGDTAFSVAKKNSITVDQLSKWNDLNASAIKIGQVLRIK